MVSLPVSPPARFVAADLPAPMELRLARRGGRAFAPRGPTGEIRVVLPEVGGAYTVLVPRGFGHPLPARRDGGALRAEQGGTACAPARWVPAGGLAAWLRAVPAPRGPVRAVPAELPIGADGAWIHVRVAALEWSTLRRIVPAAGHGAVAVADRWVRAVSPAARARGVSRGMSTALARRRCPGLVLLPRPIARLESAIEASLRQWLGGVTPCGRGYLARLDGSAGSGPGALVHAERLARLLWQELGVEAKVGIAASAEAAAGLSALLEPGWVGVVAPDAEAAWASAAPAHARASAGGRRAGWHGEPLPDVQGAAARARLLSTSVHGAAKGASVRVRIEGARGTRSTRVQVPWDCGRAAFGRLVEAVVRREGALLGAIYGVRLVCLTPGVGASEGGAGTGSRRAGGAYAPSSGAASPANPEAEHARARASARARRAQASAAAATAAAATVAAAGAPAGRVDPAAEAALGRRAIRARPIAAEGAVQLALLPGLR